MASFLYMQKQKNNNKSFNKLNLKIIIMKKIILLLIFSISIVKIYAQFPTNGLIAGSEFNTSTVGKGANNTSDFLVFSGFNYTSTNDRFGNASAIQLNEDYLRRLSVDYGGTTLQTTFSFWVKTSTNDTNSRILMDITDRDNANLTFGSDKRGISIVLLNGKIYTTVQAYKTGFGSSITTGVRLVNNGTNIISDNEWHHVALRVSLEGSASTYSIKSVLFVDGILEGTQNSATFLLSPSTFTDYEVNQFVSLGTLSKVVVNDANRYEDEMDDFLIYNRLLTDIEITDIFEYNNYSLSTNNFTIIDFSVYPNPVQNTLVIQLEETLKKAEIYTILGEKVLESTSKTINTNSLAQGMYVLKVETTNSKVATQKIIKE